MYLLHINYILWHCNLYCTEFRFDLNCLINQTFQCDLLCLLSSSLFEQNIVMHDLLSASEYKMFKRWVFF